MAKSPAKPPKARAKPAKAPPPAHEMREVARPPGRDRIAIAPAPRIATRGLWFLPYYDPRSTITPAQRLAFKSMMRHPVVKAAVLAKVWGVASLDWDIQPANPDNPADQECRLLHRHNIERIPLGLVGLAQTVLIPMLIDGYQAAEKVREVERDEPKFAGKIVYSDVRSKPTEMYDLMVDEFANVIGIAGRGVNQGKDYPISEFVFTRYLAIYDNPAGNSDFAAAYAAFWMADTVTKLRAVHAEKFVSPTVVAKYANPDDKPNLMQTLEDMKSRTWAAVPEAVQIEALNLAAQGESDFKSFIDDCDKKMAIGITGAYLQFLESTGQDPRGNANVSKSVSELFQWILVAILQEVYNKQISPEITRWNYVGVTPPKLVLGGVTEEEVAKILGNAGLLQGLGFSLSKKDLSRRTSYQEADPGDPEDELKRPVQPVPPGSPYGAPGVAPGGTFRERVRGSGGGRGV